MLHAVIMAGGSGTRFWPASRDPLPKQLLSLAGDRTMLQTTVDRLGDLTNRVLIATNEALVSAVAAQLPQLPATSLLGEPCKRDTAPCIGLAALRVVYDDPEGIMLVMPSDHVIRPEESFRDALRAAVRLVEERPGRLVTFGIKPTYPAEIFGYIERGEQLDASTGTVNIGKQIVNDGKQSGTESYATYRVVKFREKPKAELARQFIDAGNFYWNSGIFVWRAKTILDSLAKHEPEMYSHLAAINDAFGKPDYESVLRKRFAEIRGKSIDFAVMEKADDVAVIEAPFEWDDVGSWQAIARLRGVDKDGNTIAGRHVGLDTHGCIVRTDDEHLVVTLGLKDCIVVHTPDATLVANKHDEEAIRKLVQLIEERGWKKYL